MKKFISVFLSALLFLSLTLAVMRQISWMYFWVLAVVSGIFAFKIIPKME